MRHLKWFLPAGLVVLAACTDNPIGVPAPEASRAGSEAGGQTLTFMTRNLYIGADVDAVIAALVSPDPSDDLPALLDALGTLQRTDLSTRAAAIAEEVARNRPDAIGLQEVYDLDVDLTALGLPVVIHQDFLATLEGALAQRGLNYVVAAKVTDTDASPIPGIRLVDHDVLLVNADRVTFDPNVVARQFVYNIGPVAPGVDLRRGYVVVNAIIAGTSVTIVNTHLESGYAPGLDQLRAAQASELAAVIGSAAPVVVLGDLNDTPGTPMYAVLTGAGLRDAWADWRPGADGLTCCHLADLSNRHPTFYQRVDYTFTRGFGNGAARGRVALTGDRPSDRVMGPAGLIWPSDHAGVVTTVLLTPTMASR
jgi:endonuclease/exonuclease/phosphatase family metal-dependent hydrolase